MNRLNSMLRSLRLMVLDALEFSDNAHPENNWGVIHGISIPFNDIRSYLFKRRGQ